MEKWEERMDERMDEKSGEKMTLLLESRSSNEKLARVVVAAFFARLDPTLEEVEDVKTAVSEAVTNAVIHGYEGGMGEIRITAWLRGRELTVAVADDGIGIEDLQRAREPLFTSKPESGRSGMGFCFMETFMDEVKVETAPGEGTRVIMRKCIKER